MDSRCIFYSYDNIVMQYLPPIKHNKNHYGLKSLFENFNPSSSSSLIMFFNIYRSKAHPESI